MEKKKKNRRRKIFFHHSQLFPMSFLFLLWCVSLFISTLKMYCAFALADTIALVMFVKHFKIYCKYGRHIHPQTNKHEGNHPGVFQSLALELVFVPIWALVISITRVRSPDWFSIAFPARLWVSWKAGSIFSYPLTVSSLMAGTCLTLTDSHWIHGPSTASRWVNLYPKSGPCQTASKY